MNTNLTSAELTCPTCSSLDVILVGEFAHEMWCRACRTRSESPRGFLARTHLDAGGVRRWSINNVVVQVAKFAPGVEVPAGQAAAEALQTILWDRANAAPQFGTELAALRVEFGRGHAVVNAQSGRVYRT